MKLAVCRAYLQDPEAALEQSFRVLVEEQLRIQMHAEHHLTDVLSHTFVGGDKQGRGGGVTRVRTAGPSLAAPSTRPRRSEMPDLEHEQRQRHTLSSTRPSRWGSRYRAASPGRTSLALPDARRQGAARQAGATRRAASAAAQRERSEIPRSFGRGSRASSSPAAGRPLHPPGASSRVRASAERSRAEPARASSVCWRSSRREAPCRMTVIVVGAV